MPITSTLFSLGDGPLRGELEKSGVRIRILHERAGLSPVPTLELRRALASSGVQLVHAHLTRPGVHTRLAARNLHLPVVYTEHNVWDSYHPLTRLALRTTFGLTDAVVPVSDEVAKSMRVNRARHSEVLVRRIYNGVAAERLGSSGLLRQELGLSDGAPLIGTVAHLHKAKDLPTLLRALHLVQKKGQRITCAIFGRDDGQGRHLRSLAHVLDLDSSVIFMGYREDVVRLLPELDVFVLSSLHEGLPIALLEAMAAGIPAVVTDAGGNKEAILHEECGLVVPPRDPNGLAGAILDLLKDKNRCDMLGRNARARYEQLFTPGAMANAYLNLYREVLARKGKFAVMETDS